MAHKIPRGLTLAEKLDRFIDRSGGPDACWPWLGAVDNCGYGRIAAFTPAGNKTTLLTHRVAAGITDPVAMHTCDNPPCCNPAHIRGATQRENLADMDSKNRRGKRGPDKKPRRKRQTQPSRNLALESQTGSKLCNKKQTPDSVSTSSTPAHSAALRLASPHATYAHLHPGVGT